MPLETENDIVVRAVCIMQAWLQLQLHKKVEQLNFDAYTLSIQQMDRLDTFLANAVACLS